MKFRDRIKELRRVPARELAPNCRNWRTHPLQQSQALRAVLADVGWADAVLVRETPTGLELIDGHLRAETAGDELIPVLVLDVDEQESMKILATLDPLAALAGIDAGKLDELLDRVTFDDEAVAAMLADLKAPSQAAAKEDIGCDGREVDVEESWSVVVQCQSEAEQREVYEQIVALGRKCRLVSL